MLNVNINYPYPVIREYVDDFENTVFEGKFAVRLEPDCYAIHPAFNINNSEIEFLISEGQLTYAVEVQCVSTWYRHLFPIKDNKVIKLDPKKIHERVEITPCIIAANLIENYTNKDFAEEYSGIKFVINVGDVVGIGPKRTFDALYQNDIMKNGSSIVNVDGKDSAKEISCDFTGNTITIILPIEQFEDYKDCGYNKSKYKLLNAVLVIPVLIEAIGIIYNDEQDPEHMSGFEGKAWYKTIVANLKRFAENDENKYMQLLNKPFASAELLLGNNSAAVLEFLSQLN